MPIYLYETIPQQAGQKPKQFELQQSMKDAPLETHPETGEPVMLGNHEARYFLPIESSFTLSEGEVIKAGDVIAKMPREAAKTKDITGGLPRVVELFEARTPKEHAIIATTCLANLGGEHGDFPAVLKVNAGASVGAAGDILVQGCLALDLHGLNAVMLHHETA